MSKEKIESQLAELEKNKAFCKQHIPFSYKWKNWIYLGPILLLFMSIFCILYLLQCDKLVSWYTAPYLVVFVIATIWLKSARKYLTNRILNKPEMFITGFAKPVLTEKYKVYVLFSTGENRHSSTYITHQTTLISSSYADLIPQLKPGMALPVHVDNQELTAPFYLCCLRKFSVRKNNIGWNEESAFPLLLINQKTVKSIA